jgi:hypothetical protein
MKFYEEAEKYDRCELNSEEKLKYKKILNLLMSKKLRLRGFLQTPAWQ